MTRREILEGITAYLLAGKGSQKYHFRHAHTGETVYIGRDEAQRLVPLLRDWREPGTQYTVDPSLLDLMFLVAERFNKTIVINSGFRTPETNRFVGGASRSMHQHAKAVDFHIPGVPIRAIVQYLKGLKLGGVGQYKTHVHMDTGRYRTW